MKDKCRVRKIVYWLIAAALMAGLLLLACCFPLTKQYGSAELVTFGDSVFGNVRDDSAIPAQLQVLTGKQTFNAAFGGTCAAKISGDSQLDYSLDALSLAALTQAIRTEDFGPQQTMRTKTDSSLYFDGTVDALSAIDFNTVKTVLIAHGINDYLAGVPLDDEDNSVNTYTYGGALRSAVQNLRKVNPNLRIVLVSPTYIWLPDWGMNCEEYRGAETASLLEEYVAKQQEIAAQYGLEFVDLYHDLYVDDTFDDWKEYTIDGVHPTESSRQMIAEMIAERLKGGND